MNFGDRVEILGYNDYKGKYKGQFGNIKRNRNSGHIGIKLDNFTNSASQYGIFWFNIANLKLVENNESDGDDFMTDDYKVAGIKFMEGYNKDVEYYYALYDDTIEIDDIVVVKTGHHGLIVAKVSSISETNVDKVKYGREVISKVDFTTYNTQKEKIKKIKELKKIINAKVKEFQVNAMYEMIAEKDIEFKNILEEIKSLSNK